ncbi:Proton-coupled amino acid transporter 4 [Thelohanellus kitauei]|uniref:Proton-coupled amino acid transporter 4 n=1 Tax=Thelohanellus kitauei TaxID=669202 RepID=A0A0C2MM39_THEKT|nr:Proton-coupled amino acid transporter 4 [Thelohanellus kitauei]
MVKVEGLRAERDDEYDYIDKEEETNFMETVMNLLKLNVGLGVLTLPFALREGGLYFGSILIPVIGLVITYNMIIMSETNLALSFKYNKKWLGFAGTVKYSLEPYVSPRILKMIVFTIKSVLLLYLIGSCSLYIISASEIIDEVTGNMFKDKRAWTVIIAFPVICLTFVSNLSTISLISAASNFLILFGLACVFIYSVPNVKSEVLHSKFVLWNGVPNCVNTVVFAYEGIISMLPVVNLMRDKSRIKSAIKWSNGMCIIFYSLIGTFCYLAFGTETKPQVLLNLPHSTWFNLIKILYAFGIILSFIVTIYCTLTLILPVIFQIRKFHIIEKTTLKLLVRFLLILTGVSLAVGFPWLEDTLNILGAFFSLPISFIIPPIVHTITILQFEDSGYRKYIRLCLNLSFGFIGLFLTIVGIRWSISSIST